MIKNISFKIKDSFLNDYNENENPINSLNNLSKINLFVGANNSVI